MFLEGQCVPSLPLGKYTFCLTPSSTGDTLQPLMNMAPVHFLNDTTRVENKLTRECYQHKADFWECFSQAAHTISHTLTHKRRQHLPILTSCIHCTPCVPIATRENPIVAPTMQWVPDIGSFKNDAISCQTAEPRNKLTIWYKQQQQRNTENSLPHILLQVLPTLLMHKRHLLKRVLFLFCL